MPFAGVGVDIVEIERVERILARTPAFGMRVFTAEERLACETSSRPAAQYAARLAARAAVLKALGCAPLSGKPADVSVVIDQRGRYQAELAGAAAEAAVAQGVQEVALSLSFNRESAIANAVAVTPEARPQAKQAADRKEELARSFREARSIIDELDAATELAARKAETEGERSPQQEE